MTHITHQKIEYNPTIETLICITEEATVILNSNRGDDKDLAGRVFKKKDEYAESIQEFYQRYIDWANEFEEIWVNSGEQYEGNPDFFDSVAPFTRKKLEEYAEIKKQYEVSIWSIVTATNKEDAIKQMVEEIKNGNTDDKITVRTIIYDHLKEGE